MGLQSRKQDQYIDVYRLRLTSVPVRKVVRCHVDGTM